MANFYEIAISVFLSIPVMAFLIIFFASSLKTN